MKGYRIFDHTADLGVAFYGRTEEDLFARAGVALFDLLTELDRVEPRIERPLRVEGMDRADLLVNYLRECLYLFNGERFLLREIRIQTLGPEGLEAQVRGEPFDPRRHRIKTEIKAVTYHQASVRESPSGEWTARVVFDV